MLISINHFIFYAYIIGNNQILYNYHIYHCIFTFTGFCHQFYVYLGKGHNPADGKGLPYHVVINLSEGLRGKYHHVYFDSYFTSIPLAGIRPIIRQSDSSTVRRSDSPIVRQMLYFFKS
jgi:hypothetical protein